MPEPHHLHLAAMRHSVADVRYAAKEIDTRTWLATVPHLAPPPVKPRDADPGPVTVRGLARFLGRRVDFLLRVTLYGIISRDMSKPAAIHADLTAAQIQERIDALTAKLGAVLDARKAAHVHAAIEPSAWIERCACGARRVVAGGKWSA